MTNEPRSTAPKWAQRLGLTTRHQALEFQARAAGFENRTEFEHARKEIRAAGPEAQQRWRTWLKATQEAEVNDTQENRRIAAEERYYLNQALPPEARLDSPKARPARR